ncbi:hypothetical protein KSP39_PZI015871 [Platanthera zijinensis]|uniref:Uncharacterized protein n=1 Tax=Platanthera zijinensis TaxID=2320716 RepID=A0AAP0B8V1_9ASPA
MGINDDMFRTIRSQIINMDPLPTVSKTYAVVTREKRHRTIVRGQEGRGDTAIMVIHTSTNIARAALPAQENVAVITHVLLETKCVLISTNRVMMSSNALSYMVILLGSKGKGCKNHQTWAATKGNVPVVRSTPPIVPFHRQ